MKAHDLFRTANVATILSLLSLLGLGAGVSCASGDGTGSESHFACRKDEDCTKHGPSLVCIDKECVEDETDGVGGRAAGTGAAASTAGSGESPEPAPYGTQTLPPLTIEPACGSYSLGARLEAAETLVRLTQQRRKQLTDVCAGLSGKAAPATPKDDDVTRLCGTATTSVGDMLGPEGVIGASLEPMWIDTEAQFTCEQEAAAEGGCFCGSYTLEGRCAAADQATIGCTAQCSGACFGGGPSMCQGTCNGSCQGTCDGDCSTRSGPDCQGRCEGTCTGTCTGSCLGDVSLACSGVCVGACSAPAPIAGCAGFLTPAPCCPDASDAYPACKALGILRGGTGRAALSRAGSEFRSENLRSLHQVMLSLALMMVAAESVLPGLPRQADLPASCVAEIGPRLTTLITQTSDADATLNVMLLAAFDVVGAEVPRSR